MEANEANAVDEANEANTVFNQLSLKLYQLGKEVSKYHFSFHLFYFLSLIFYCKLLHLSLVFKPNIKTLLYSI